MDFNLDPRDDHDRSPGGERNQGSRGATDTRELEHDLSDPRDVFMRHLDLPRGVERELVRDRDRDYRLRGSETRTLSIVGAFRVVSARDLRGHDDRRLNPRTGDLRHLREQGLVQAVPMDGRRDVAVVLTDRGRNLLAARRGRSDGREQTFYSQLKKARELEHDVQVYRAYEREAERLQERGARIDRVVLDYELKREYQRFLQARNRGREDHDGRPDRTREEVEDWAREHDLPVRDGRVQFPDARIEYQDEGGFCQHLDLEVVTVHYRGAHTAPRPPDRDSVVSADRAPEPAAAPSIQTSPLRS